MPHVERLWMEITHLLALHGPPQGIPRVVAAHAGAWLQDLNRPVRFCYYDPDRRVYLPAHPQWLADKLKLPLPPERVAEYQEAVAECCARTPAGQQPALVLGPTDALFLAEMTWVFPTFAETLLQMRAAMGFRLATLIYDVIPCVEPQFFAAEGLPDFPVWARAMLRASDAIVTISQHSRRDILDFAEYEVLPAPPVEVTRLGDTFLSVGEAKPPADPRLTNGTPFVLMVGTVECRKNQLSAYQAWRRLLKVHGPQAVPRLVLAGRPGRLTADLMAQIAGDRVTRGHVIVPDHVGDEELAWLYRHCLFTVYPSHYEGWGLPIAESCAFGKYCIAGNSTSMPEVAGDLIDYCDPLDVPGLVRLLERALFDGDYLRQREQQLTAGYRKTTWEETAAQTWGLLETHLGTFGAVPTLARAA